MSGFYLSTKIQSSIIHYQSHRLSKFRHIEKETVRGRWAIPNYLYVMMHRLRIGRGGKL